MPRSLRANGPSNAARVQAEPSHVHVSLKYSPNWSQHPPNTTVCRCRTSYAIPKLSRAAGPVVATRIHVEPFHSHVSPRTPPPAPRPPKRTTRLRTTSYEMPMYERADGDASGWSCFHVVPFQL